MKNLVLSIVAYALVFLAVAIGASVMSGCATPMVHQPTPAQPDPIPPPDVGVDCADKVQSMQLAVSIAKIGASVAVGSNSRYGPALRVAFVAIDAALANAKAQCASGTIDGWTVALAAFDAAMQGLVIDGREFGVQSADGDYATSTDQFASRLLAEELAD